jgi:hypothetical protein
MIELSMLFASRVHCAARGSGISLGAEVAAAVSQSHAVRQCRSDADARDSGIPMYSRSEVERRAFDLRVFASSGPITLLGMTNSCNELIALEMECTARFLERFFMSLRTVCESVPTQAESKAYGRCLLPARALRGFLAY